MKPPNVIPIGIYLSVDTWADIYKSCGISIKPQLILRDVGAVSSIVFTESVNTPPPDANIIFTLPADNNVYRSYTPSNPEMRLYAKLEGMDDSIPNLFVYLPSMFGSLAEKEESR